MEPSAKHDPKLARAIRDLYRERDLLEVAMRDDRTHPATLMGLDNQYDGCVYRLNTLLKGGLDVHAPCEPFTGEVNP